MPHPSLLLRALVVASATAISALTLGATTASASAHTAVAAAPVVSAPTDPDDPLTLRMRSITPDYVPDHGPIVIQGRITNSSEEEWTAINVHAFIGSTPMTTAAELSAAMSVPTTSYVGNRITAPGTFDHIDALQPGQSTAFTVRIPRADLPVSATGVYWFGVHALGANSDGRPDTAVGRDRTFLPLVAANDGQVDTALVVPVRASITYASDGSLADPAGWAQSVANGSLRAAIEVGQAASGRPLTWLVDPAVPDAVRRLVAGNPGRSLGVADTPGDDDSSPSASPTSESSAAAGPTNGSVLQRQASISGVVTADAASAVEHHWLRRLRHFLAQADSQILGLPYGDLAVDSAAQLDRPLLGAAITHTGDRLSPWGLPVDHAVSPPSGGLGAAVVDALPQDTQVLLGDDAVQGSAGTVDTISGRQVVLTSTGAEAGGPGPRAPLGALALRQRILSEAALRLGSGQPLVVQLPRGWSPGRLGGFFDGLDVPWLRLTTVGQAVADTTPTALTPAQLRAPATPAGHVLGPEIYAAAGRSITDSKTLGSMLATQNSLPSEVFAEATSNASYTARADPFFALTRLEATQTWVSQRLAAVKVEAPESVTLASSRGSFSAVVTNDLDVPVNVEVHAIADPALKITGGDEVQLPPHGRRTMLLKASTHVLGVHTVSLEVTTPAGVAIGSADEFPIRAEQVSRLIWVIIGTGLALLFAAIVVRLVRRLIRSRA